MSKSERDIRIGKLYSEGVSQAEISKQFRLGRSRVRQIIKNSGLQAPTVKGRAKFLGVNLTETVKQSLKKEATKRGLSMSNLTSQTVTEMLVALGYKVVDDGDGHQTVVEES